MTKREEIYATFLRVRHEYQVLHGEKQPVRCDDEYIGSEMFRYHAKQNTTDYYLSQISYMQGQIDRMKKQKEVDQFFSTEDGAKYMQYLLQIQTEAQHDRERLMVQTELAINKIINRVLGDGWGVRFNTSEITIGIIDKNNDKTDVPDFVRFTNRFSFLINTFCSKERRYRFTVDDMRFELSYGAGLSWDVFKEENKDKLAYEIGKGKLLADTEALIEIRQLAYEAIKENWLLLDDYEYCSNKLSNPTQADLDEFLNEQN